MLNGTWEATFNFPRFSEDGTWKAQARAGDQAFNFNFLSAADLQSLGFSADLVVIKPSLIPDDTVFSGGGTAVDDTFGTRAQVIFPPGAVSVPTDVAIDVFPNPLAVPTPAGFSGPGTLFVNIDLTPPPSFPLPAPGLTVTLPLQNFLAPGTLQSLFRIDTATGMLVPALDSLGAPIAGTVDARVVSAQPSRE